MGLDFKELEYFKDWAIHEMKISDREEREVLEKSIFQIRERWEEHKAEFMKMSPPNYYDYDQKEKHIQTLKGIPIFLVFTSSFQTDIAKGIMAYTESKYCHVSLALNANLMNLYSFSIQNIGNETGEINGGFSSQGIYVYRRQQENIRVICIFLSAEKYQMILKLISEMIKHQKKTSYNYRGLINYVLGKWDKTEPNNMFCSEFIMYLFGELGISVIEKAPCFTSPKDIADLNEQTGVYRLYDGSVKYYNKGKILEIIEHIEDFVKIW